MPDSLSRSQREDGITPADSRESQNRFDKEMTRRRPKTCKYHYFAGDNQSHRSTACGFFTDDRAALGPGFPAPAGYGRRNSFNGADDWWRRWRTATVPLKS